MKIGLVCMNYLAARGGLEKYTVALSDALVRRGHDVHVFAHRGEPGPGIRYHRVPMFPVSSPGKNFSFAVMAAKHAAAQHLDVVQSMERIWNQDIYRASDGINPIQMQEQYPNPVIRRIKAAGPRRQVLSLLERRIYQDGGARFVMTNSKLVKKQILEYYRMPESRIAVIYNSVDSRIFNPSVKDRFRAAVRQRYGVGQDELLILFAGNDFQRKGLQPLMEAVFLLKDEPLKLIVAGSEPADRYKTWLTGRGLEKTVMFTGHQETLAPLYGASDLFILPTRYDAFANVCLEAMACGTPVITTTANGACEVIDSGRDGYVLHTASAPELARCILKFRAMTDPPAMAARAAEKAHGFTVDRYMQQIFCLYDRVREEKSR